MMPTTTKASALRAVGGELGADRGPTNSVRDRRQRLGAWPPTQACG